jgi:glycogen debranching enzyme
VSGRSGNIVELGPQGFFYEDTRFLSGLHLLINDIDPEVVDAATMDGDEAIFYLRSRTVEQGERTEPGLLIRRHRFQGPTLHEDVIVENWSGDETSVVVELELEADFADLLDVHLLGPAREREISAQHFDGELIFTYATDGYVRSTLVKTSQPSLVHRNRILLSAEIAPGKQWKTCLDIIPVLDGIRQPVSLSCATKDHRHALAGAPALPSPQTSIRSSADALEHLWAQSLTDLASLEFMMDGQPAFAAGIPWYVALFGRDSVITAIEAMLLDQETALGTATLLAEMQGTEDNPAISEEPGKILHEVRFGERSQPEIGGGRYYGSVDSTPLWCILVGQLRRWGCEPDRIATLLPALRAAVGWIERRLEVGDGLLTYEGDKTLLPNQGWKDSYDAMVDGRGQFLTTPIAVVEAQGYAVAALREAARIEAELGEASREDSHLALADELQQRIKDMFWRDDLGTFAMALGRDGQVADTVSSNPGHLLWAGAVSPEHAGAVAESLVSDELWSGWGVRTLSARNPAYHPVSYHRGSVWPHDNMLCIAGLMRYGHTEQALALAGGLLSAASHFSYGLPELFSGIGWDQAEHPIPYPTSSSPQAWAAAVPIYLIQQLLGIEPDVPNGTVIVSPRLPDDIDLRLDDLRVGDGVLSIEADGTRAHILKTPSGIDIVVR